MTYVNYDVRYRYRYQVLRYYLWTYGPIDYVAEKALRTTGPYPNKSSSSIDCQDCQDKIDKLTNLVKTNKIDDETTNLKLKLKMHSTHTHTTWPCPLGAGWQTASCQNLQGRRQVAAVVASLPSYLLG